MCGLAGLWKCHDVDAVQSMLERLIHRGPDDEGRFERRSCTLGHRRLSIVDTEGGHQPLLNEQRSLAATVNGEIYNARALRDELEPRHRFDTHSDSETPLHLYAEQGPDAIDSLDGMFAIAIADGDELFLARDPIGIKPLYIRQSDDSIIYASELKAFSSVSEAVIEFPPGTWFRSDLGMRSYYRVPWSHPEVRSIPYWRDALRRTLDRAVEKRLMSDVPVGTFLSGGLDSSIITALAQRHLGRVHTVAVGMKGSPDLAAAREVAHHLGTFHHERTFSAEDIARHLPRIIYHLESFDVDLVRSAIPCFFASRLAAEHVKVVLSGEGADELFAGYTYHKEFGHPDQLHAELGDSVGALHNMNLQRVDRMTMAHSIEGRVPFLDLDVISLAGRIPAPYKISREPPAEKLILRLAFEDMLPGSIVWRDKSQFDEGSGTADCLVRTVVGMADRYGVSADGARDARELEERIYRSLFNRYFPCSAERLVARWRGHSERRQSP
jgi:asparagine synthase (glutamine-hydrolysing)